MKKMMSVAYMAMGAFAMYMMMSKSARCNAAKMFDNFLDEAQDLMNM